MIGFITTPEISASVTEAIREAQTSRELPVTWLIIGMPILTGEHAGNHFLPADDDVLECPIRENLTPVDFPEFMEIIDLLGGLSARVDLDPAHITAPVED